VQLRTAWGQTVERTAYVRPRGVLKVLATGDSMIQYVDLSLRKRLAKRARVRSDAHVSTGLSKPALLDWVKYAKRQAKSRPAVTVMFIGANDGFPIGGHNCCSSAWIDAYAARARSMMQTYARRGRGVVYWLSLPAPRPAQWRRIYPAVNKALFKAAAGLGPAVRVINLGKTFTPHGFRAQMTWKGRRLTVRQADGVHLNQAGASIAAGLVQRAMRADGVL
jgi:hypothetical protein